MKDIDDVLKDIKQIDGQADRLKDMISNAYEGYEYNGASEVIINRDKGLDRINSSAYRVQVNSPSSPTIIAMVDEGKDHYVATVVDAYIENQ